MEAKSLPFLPSQMNLLLHGLESPPLQRNCHPEVMRLILPVGKTGARLQAWWISGDSFREAGWPWCEDE